MNRRNFCQILGSIFGIGAVATAKEVNEELPIVEGPFCVEIYSPEKERERSLPIFDNMKQARNLALARMNFIKQTDRSGKILITKPNGEVCECLTWGPNWTQTMAYVNCKGEAWKH